MGCSFFSSSEPCTIRTTGSIIGRSGIPRTGAGITSRIRVKRWCRIYSCWREALEGSDFCERHDHQKPRSK